MLIIEKLPTRYSEGSATVVANEVTVTPTDALWYGNVWGDDLFFDPAQPLVPPQRIASVNEDGTLTLAYPWPGDTMTEAPYEVRYIGIIERSTAQTRRVLEQLGDVSAYYDVQVDTLADRDAYDNRPAGFRILVSNIGGGRAAIYSKNSATSGDWSDPAYVTGPAIDVTVGTVTELDYGDTPTITGTSGPGTLELDFGLPGGPALSVGTVTRGDADVTSTPVTGGYELDFTIPSQVAQGDYSGATAYVTGDIVQDQGSSWVALQATTGNAPPTLPTTSNAYWQLLARAGNDGAGTVTSLVAGDGIDIDSTDPTQPIVSGAVFDEGESGDVPGPTGANITDGALLSASGEWVSGATVRTAIDAISGVVVKTTVYTTSGTHTFGTNCVGYTLDLVGGGGGGGGTNTTSGDASACTGGGSGGDWSGVVSGNIQPSATIVIGAGGGSGSNGGESSYSDGVRSVTCPGGVGGGGTSGVALPTQTEVSAVTPTQSGWGGSNQLVVFSSAQGSPRANGIGSTCLGSGRSWGYGSQGGSTRFGMGGAGSVSGSGSSQTAPGRPGTGFGAGGGGAAPVNGANNSMGGGAGSGGMCKIVEFIKVP